MGEVYKARDTRLDRTVAVKVLPTDLAADPDRRARFEREARAIAALSHPHICTIHDVGRHEDIDYLVMEYLEGETLTDRLAHAKGPLPLGQVLTIGSDIADALDKAHRAGITHRDVKPANIFLVRRGGTSAPDAKLLDFGLAKLRGPAASITMSAMTKATATPATAAGTILGTIHYMAPEQVEGREADTRSDIWALGAVIYEMATGQRPFDGASAASVIGAILKDTPPAVSTRQPLAPSALDHLVERCLEKDADDRWQDAGDVKHELTWIADGGTAVAPVDARTRNRWSERVAWMTAAAAVLTALFFLLRPASAPAMGVVRLSILPPDKTRFTGQNTATLTVPELAVSPDGRAIVFAAAAPGARPTLWLRSLDAVTAYSLPGTEGAESPFWSPDHRWIGYFADGKLKKTPASGGPSQVIAANVSDNRQASWGPDDTIILSRGITGVLRVPSSGGMVTPVTELDASRQEGSHRFPQFLPDGRHFLFSVRSSLADQTGVYAGSLDGMTKKLAHSWQHARAPCALRPPAVSGWRHPDGPGLRCRSPRAQWTGIRCGTRGRPLQHGSWFVFSLPHGHVGLRGHPFNTRPVDLVRSGRNPVRVGRVSGRLLRFPAVPRPDASGGLVSGSEDRLPRYLDHGPHAAWFSAVHVWAGH